MIKNNLISKIATVVLIFSLSGVITACSGKDSISMSTEVAIEPCTMYVTYCTKVRDLPSKDSNVIALYDIGTEVTVVATEGDFSKIEYKDSSYAYIDSSLLAENKPEEISTESD